MKLRFSRHAEEQMIDRGISVSEVLRAIRAGSTFRQAPDKYVAEYSYFSVVYKLINKTYFIITVQPRN